MTSSMRVWAQKYDIVNEAEILISSGFDTLPTLINVTDDDLISLGINKVGTRKKILTAISSIKEKSKKILESGGSLSDLNTAIAHHVSEISTASSTATSTTSTSIPIIPSEPTQPSEEDIILEERRTKAFNIRYEAICSVLDIAVDKYVGKHGVHGVGITKKITNGKETEALAITFYVQKKSAVSELKKEDVLPDHIQGYPTDVFVCDPPQRHTDTSSYDPLEGGIQIGNASSFGTAGLIVKQTGSGGQTVILTCEHVIKGLTDIYQPAAVSNANKIGKTVSKYDGNYKYTDDKEYYIDAAIVSTSRSGTYLKIAEVKQKIANTTVKATIGKKVWKRGCKTTYTKGTIKDINYTTYGGKNNIRIEGDNNVNFCDNGDSGSAIIGTSDNKLTGLLWGGAGVYTWACHIDPIIHYFNIKLDN